MTNVILDACCLINLCAAGDLASILAALGAELYVSTKVMEEAYYTLRRDEDGSLVSESIELAPALGTSLMRVCHVQGGEETGLFVRLAATLDDGEAASMAIAKVRGRTLATDDRKAIRIAEGLGVTLVSTPELMAAWAERTGASAEGLASALGNIQTFARFAPRRDAPWHRWWSEHLGDQDA